MVPSPSFLNRLNWLNDPQSIAPNIVDFAAWIALPIGSLVYAVPRVCCTAVATFTTVGWFAVWVRVLDAFNYFFELLFHFVPLKDRFSIVSLPEMSMPTTKLLNCDRYFPIWLGFIIEQACLYSSSRLSNSQKADTLCRSNSVCASWGMYGLTNIFSVRLSRINKSPRSQNKAWYFFIFSVLPWLCETQNQRVSE